MSSLIRKSSFVSLAQRRRQGGAGYLEFAIAATIFAILAGVLLQKLRFYQEEAERLSVMQVVSSLRAGLASKATSLYLEGKQGEFAALDQQNPMEWLERKPANYAGEFDRPKPGEIAPGHWYFDRGTATLSYLLNEREFFGGNDAKLLNFKVKFAPMPSNITKSNEGPGPSSITLEQIN